MRLAIAAAFLAQTLPVASLNSGTDTVFNLDKINLLKKLQSSRLSLLHQEKKPKKWSNHSFHPPTSRKVLHNKKKTLSNVASRLLHPLHESVSTKLECNPDVGVLACGIGKYCRKDDTSSLGGVCTPTATRSQDLIQMGDPYTIQSSTSYYWRYCASPSASDDCDCGGFYYSRPTQLGSLTCEVEPTTCMYNCPDLCSSEGVYYVLFTDSSWLSRRCWYYTQPYEQKFCVSITSYGSCKLYLDGQQCSKCDMMSSSCGEFDCTNVGMGKGDFCDDDLIPPVYYASTCSSATPVPTNSGTHSGTNYDFYTSSPTSVDNETPYDPCFLCDGRGVDYPYSQFYLGSDSYGCYVVDWMAQSGNYFDSMSCDYLADLVKSYCCASDHTSNPTSDTTHVDTTYDYYVNTFPPTTKYDPCFLCDGRGVDYPDSQFYWPYYGNYECSLVDSWAQSGNYMDEDFCDWLSLAAKSSCCVSDSTTSDPTSDPGTPYDPCYLCYGREVDYPDAQLYLPSYGFANCAELDTVAKSGYQFNEETCTVLSTWFQESPCCAHASVYDPCYLCDGESVAYPGSQFYFDDGSYLPCYFIAHAAEGGNYFDTEQSAASSFAPTDAMGTTKPTMPSTLTSAPSTSDPQVSTIRPTTYAPSTFDPSEEGDDATEMPTTPTSVPDTTSPTPEPTFNLTGNATFDPSKATGTPTSEYPGDGTFNPSTLSPTLHASERRTVQPTNEAIESTGDPTKAPADTTKPTITSAPTFLRTRHPSTIGPQTSSPTVVKEDGNETTTPVDVDGPVDLNPHRPGRETDSARASLPRTIFTVSCVTMVGIFLLAQGSL
eukprot:Nitzschia sp. Nitz4//scaffold206_size41850//23066//25585//NITZ4_007424-RA/size41850-processed-gene-0.45-mRNA-1//1//CDS//3329541571//1257//frame0